MIGEGGIMQGTQLNLAGLSFAFDVIATETFGI